MRGGRSRGIEGRCELLTRSQAAALNDGRRTCASIGTAASRVPQRTHKHFAVIILGRRHQAQRALGEVE